MAEIINLAAVREALAAKRLPNAAETEEDTILRRIQQIADNLGIDVEAPFRRRPAPPSQPRHEADDPGRKETFRLLAQIRKNLGMPPYSRGGGEWVVTRRTPEQH